MLQELLADQVRRNAGIVADADIGVRRAEIDGLQLGVHVGEVQQRHLALGVELQQVILGQLLLRQSARVKLPLKPAAAPSAMEALTVYCRKSRLVNMAAVPCVSADFS
jgi:hypothetical protein